MSLKEQMRSDVTAVFLNTNDHAEPITYKGVNINAIVDRGDSDGKGNYFTTEGRSSRAVIQVSVADVPEPETGDKVIFDGKTWEMAHLLTSDGLMHELEVLTAERVY